MIEANGVPDLVEIREKAAWRTCEGAISFTHETGEPFRSSSLLAGGHHHGPATTTCHNVVFAKLTKWFGFSNKPRMQCLTVVFLPTIQERLGRCARRGSSHPL